MKKILPRWRVIFRTEEVVVMVAGSGVKMGVGVGMLIITSQCLYVCYEERENTMATKRRGERADI